jgi:hypothetical protein
MRLLLVVSLVFDVLAICAAASLVLLERENGAALSRVLKTIGKYTDGLDPMRSRLLADAVGNEIAKVATYEVICGVVVVSVAFAFASQLAAHFLQARSVRA